MSDLIKYKKKTKARTDKVTTVNLTIYQYSFLKENKVDISKLIRELVNRFILENGGKND